MAVGKSSLRQITWFWEVVRESWKRYAEVLVASFFINLLALTTPLFVMNVYDRVVPNNAIETLWVLAFGVLIAFVFDFIMRTLRTHFVDHTARNIDARLSARIFEHVMGIRMDDRPRSIGGLANTVQAFEAFREFMTSASVTILIDFPFAILFIFFIGFIGGTLLLVPLILIPIVFVVGLLLQAPLIKLIQKSYELAGAKQRTLIETLGGISTIKTTNAQSRMQHQWEEIVQASAHTSAKLRFFSSLAVNFSVFAQYLGSVLVVIVGVYKIANNNLTIGGLIACTILTGRALAPLAQIANLLMRYYQSMAGIKGVDEIMKLPIERPTDKPFLHSDKFVANVAFKDVNFSYPQSSLLALNHASFKIQAGERVALIGRVGSGKSTIQKLLVGLYKPSTGNIFVNETDIQQLDPVDIRRHIGYVPQDIVLFSGSIRDNIALGDSAASDDAILRAANLAGLDSLLSDHPEGIEMHIGERGDNLSGGQRQAIAIAQAMVHDPSLLVFDEPTHSMDDVTEARFKTALMQSLSNKTLVLVTHKGSMLTLVNRIIILDRGRVLADGPKEKILHALKEKRIKPAPRI